MCLLRNACYDGSHWLVATHDIPQTCTSDAVGISFGIDTGSTADRVFSHPLRPASDPVFASCKNVPHKGESDLVLARSLHSHNSGMRLKVLDAFDSGSGTMLRGTTIALKRHGNTVSEPGRLVLETLLPALAISKISGAPLDEMQLLFVDETNSEVEGEADCRDDPQRCRWLTREFSLVTSPLALILD